jgi:hypothetical protein
MEAYAFAEPMWRDGSILIGVPLIWGCVCAGTKVYDNTGAIRNIEELDQDDGIIGYDGSGSSQEPISWLKPPKEKPCYRIETSNGNSIECSYDHPFMWSKNKKYKYSNGNKYKFATIKRASQVKEGDQLFMIDEVPIFGDKHISYARELGLMLGDGSYTKGNTPEICASYDEVYQYLKNRYDLKWNNLFDQKNGRKYWRASFKQIRPLLEKHGMVYDGKEKTFPTDLNEFDKKSLCEFIAGYFDADGNIRPSNRGIRISLTSIHYSQVEKIKYLLVKLGITSSIYKEYPRRNGGGLSKGSQEHVFRLYISRKDDILKFIENIIPLSEEKKNTLNSYNPPKRDLRSKGKKYYFQVNPDNGKWSKKDGEIMEGMHEVFVNKVEYIGLKKVYNLTAAKNNSYLANALVTLNTGGDMEAGTVPFNNMFYNPRQFGLKAYENIYDEKATGECGYFIDNMWFYPGKKKKQVYVGSQVREQTFDSVDTQGNSHRDIAEEILDEKRERAKHGDKQFYYNFISQEPKTPKEAFMRVSGSPLPVKELIDHEANLRINPKKWKGPETVGQLIWDTEKEKLKFEPDNETIPIRNYPLTKEDNKEGAIVIWDHPQKDANDEIPYGVYIAGIDPYSDDSSQTSSLGSIIVMNRLTERIVAEYTGKPNSINSFFENCRRLLLYYNATALYESNKKGLLGHFERHHSTHLLAETPNYLREKGMINYKSVGNDTKGLKIQSREVIRHGISLYKEWLNEQIELDDETKILRLHTIKSHPILHESIYWNEEDHFNKTRNYDRISAIIQLFIYKNNLAVMHMNPDVEQSESKGENLHQFFKKQPLFKNNQPWNTGIKN